MDETDIGAIALRARFRGEAARTYNADHLIRDVVDLLGRHGMEVTTGSNYAMAHTAACQLLRALDVMPTVGVEYIDRVNAPDPDSR